MDDGQRADVSQDKSGVTRTKVERAPRPVIPTGPREDPTFATAPGALLKAAEPVIAAQGDESAPSSLEGTVGMLEPGLDEEWNDKSEPEGIVCRPIDDAPQDGSRLWLVERHVVKGGEALDIHVEAHWHQTRRFVGGQWMPYGFWALWPANRPVSFEPAGWIEAVS